MRCFMNNNVLQKINIDFDLMSQVERKIASEIISDPKKFTTYSLSELSELAQVSQGSVINFANKYASGGFPTLKLETAQVKTSPTNAAGMPICKS